MSDKISPSNSSVSGNHVAVTRKSSPASLNDTEPQRLHDVDQDLWRRTFQSVMASAHGESPTLDLSHGPHGISLPTLNSRSMSQPLQARAFPSPDTSSHYNSASPPEPAPDPRVRPYALLLSITSGMKEGPEEKLCDPASAVLHLSRPSKFPTSVLQVLVEVLATTTKICTAGPEIKNEHNQDASSAQVQSPRYVKQFAALSIVLTYTRRCGSRPFSCPDCHTYTTNRKYNLKRHRETRHGKMRHRN
jgi:hypothetical protein